MDLPKELIWRKNRWSEKVEPRRSIGTGQADAGQPETLYHLLE